MPQALNLPVKQIVADLINDANPDIVVPFTAANLGHGEIVVNPVDSTRNSSLQIWKTDDLEKKAFVHLNRLDLAVIAGSTPLLIEDEVGFTSVADLLPAVNTQFNLGLTVDDIEDTPIPAGGPYPKAVVVRIADGNIVFFGQFSLDLTDPA